MKDAYEVLRSKEHAMENLRIEIMALRVAAPLLSDDGDSREDRTPVLTRRTAPTRALQVPGAANADPQPEHTPKWKDEGVGFP
jgi:hypothetical protein